MSENTMVILEWLNCEQHIGFDEYCQRYWGL